MTIPWGRTSEHDKPIKQKDQVIMVSFYEKK